MKKLSILLAITIVSIVSFIFYKKNNALIINPQKGKISEVIYGLGIIKSHKIHEAKFAMPTVVREYFVKEGQEVEKNQALFSTDDGVVFKTPIKGTVTKIYPQLKELVPPQKTIIEIQDLKDLYAEVSLEQQGALRVKKDLPCEISFEFLRNKSFQGKVETILPQDNQFIAHLQVSGMPIEILPGMSADVAFLVAEKENVTLIPIKAINHGQILIKKNGDKQKIKVEVGLMDQEYAEIVSPELIPNDEIYLNR